MTNPVLSRLGGALSHGQQSEKKTAKRLQGRPRPASGALDGAKGDIELPTYLLENKATEKASLSIRLDWLRKISVEARQEGKTPGLSIQFVDRCGNSLRHGRWVMIPEAEFQEFQEMTDGME